MINDTSSNGSKSDTWHLDSQRAFLRTSLLAAEVDLLKPSAGLSQLVYNENSIEGFALGVSPSASDAISEDEVSDVFVRGNDLVVTYAETDERHFALQVYWRVTALEQGIVLVDSILSLQTRLLESFPDVSVCTTLPATESWLMPLDAIPPIQIDATEHAAKEVPTKRPNGVLLKRVDGGASYAEATHPEDRGTSQIASNDSSMSLTHKLGGRFLEKGVIRRLRVRGVFLPGKNDLELARKHLASLETEQPPLTV